jgi:hypothetical protein
MRSLDEISKEEITQRLIFLEDILFSICGRTRMSLPTISNKIENACDEYRTRFEDLIKDLKNS